MRAKGVSETIANIVPGAVVTIERLNTQKGVTASARTLCVWEWFVLKCHSLTRLVSAQPGVDV